MAAAKVFSTVESLFTSRIPPTNGDNAEQEDHPMTNGSGDAQGTEGDDYDTQQVSLRALVNTKEAGVIIGKQGKNVAELRESLDVKAGVSKVVPGVFDRVVSVQGALAGVAKAFELIANHMLENPLPYNAPDEKLTAFNNGQVSVRLLIVHNQMGTIIGKQGVKIKHIQQVTGARMVAQKDMLPQSTERVIELSGTPPCIHAAVFEIGKCLIDDYERGVGAVHYNPAVRLTQSSSRDHHGTTNGSRQYGHQGARTDGNHVPRSSAVDDVPAEDLKTQNISIPADMVGCIIGRGGSKISDIRQKSGSRISIAKAPHDDTGERMFTIQGTQESNEKALYLLYQQLESEKNRESRN